MKALVAAILGFFLVIAVVASAQGGPSEPGTGYPSNPALHQQLEADRMMTQQMGTDVGSGMQAGMPSNGMLHRAMDPAYVRMLDQHSHDVHRMIAQHP